MLTKILIAASIAATTAMGTHLTSRVHTLSLVADDSWPTCTGDLHKDWETVKGGGCAQLGAEDMDAIHPSN